MEDPKCKIEIIQKNLDNLENKYEIQDKIYYWVSFIVSLTTTVLCGTMIPIKDKTLTIICFCFAVLSLLLKVIEDKIINIDERNDILDAINMIKYWESDDYSKLLKKLNNIKYSHKFQ